VGAVGLAYAAVAAVALAPVYREQAGGESEETKSGLWASLRGLRADLLRPSVLALFAFFAVLTMAGKGVQTFTTVLVAEEYGFGESVANAALTAFSAAAAGGVLAGGLLADRFRPRRVILATLATGGVATWVVVREAAVGPSAAVVGFGAVGLVTGLAYPSRDRLVSRVTASGSTGRGFGFVFTGISLGGLASPALLGRVVDLAAAPAAFALVGGFYLLAAGVATRLDGE
jgi:predicted MFS family arabinose efflux permease